MSNRPQLRSVEDRTLKHEFDLPPDGSQVEDDPREDEHYPQEREAALREKTQTKALTESPAWSMLRDWVDKQKEARVRQLLLIPITEKNKDELNFMRGETAMAMLVVEFVEKVLSGAESTLEVFRESEKVKDGNSNDESRSG